MAIQIPRDKKQKDGKPHFGESFEEKVISLSNDIVTDAHFVTIGMLCENMNGEAKVMEPDEITKWEWFALDKLPKPLFKPSGKVLNNYKEGKFYKN